MKRTAFSPHDNLYINYLKNTKKHDMPVQHYHDMYEILVMLGGKRYLFCDNYCYTMERGTMAVFKPFEIHYAESRESDFYERYVINFRLEALSPLLSGNELHVLEEKLNSCVIDLTEEQTVLLCRLFKQADECSRLKGFLSEKLLLSAVLLLVMYSAGLSEGAETLSGGTADPQIVSVLKYINEHYRSVVMLDDLSDKVGISKFYLCRRFHEVTGATVMEYLNNVRLTKVHNMLLNTKNSIDDIAFETGFSSAVNLSRAFKKLYGVSPSEFRRTKKKRS